MEITFAIDTHFYINRMYSASRDAPILWSDQWAYIGLMSWSVNIKMCSYEGDENKFITPDINNWLSVCF